MKCDPGGESHEVARVRLREATCLARGGTDSKRRSGINSRLLAPKKGPFFVREMGGIPSPAEASL